MTLSHHKKIKDLKETIVERYLEQIRHEDKFFGERFSWLMAFQGFLIAPLILIETTISQIINNTTVCKSPDFSNLYYIETLLIIVGVGSIFSISSGCYAAYESIEKLIDTVTNKLNKIDEFANSTIKIEDLLVFRVISPGSRFLGLLPSFGNILLICVFWGFVTWNLKVDYILIKWISAVFLSLTIYQCLRILLVKDQGNSEYWLIAITVFTIAIGIMQFC